MKKICILCASDKPIPAVKGGAIETLIQNLIDENERQQKYHFTILTMEDKSIDYSKYKYTEFIKIPNRVLKYNKIYWKLVGALRKLFGIEILSPIQRHWEYKFLKQNHHRFDVIIEEIDLQTIVRLRSKIKSKIIYHLHYDKKTNSIEDKSFDYLMPISSFISTQWQKQTKRKKDTIYELKNCIKTEDFEKKLSDEEKSKLKQKLGINKNNIVALFVGRIIPEKGVIEMLQAIEQSNLKNFTLILIGSSNFASSKITEYEKQISKFIKSMKVQVVQLGYVDNKGLYRYQAISDFAIIPSICNEAAGLSLIESEVAGLPTIISNVGGMPEYFCKDAGILVNNDENFINNLSKAIMDMVDMKDSYNSMSENAIEWAKKFSTENYYKEFAKIIDKITITEDKNEN